MAPRRSVCWDFFTKVQNSTVAECSLCGRKETHFNNTTNLNRHLNKAHNKQYTESLRKRSSDTSNLGEDVGEVEEVEINFESNCSNENLEEIITESDDNSRLTYESASRMTAATERTVAATERTATAMERIAAAAERTAAATERTATAMERIAAATERTAAADERKAVAAEKKELPIIE